MLIIVLFVVIALVALYWLFASEKSQALGDFPWHANTTDKLVALTFDDGPNPPYTMQIVDYLDKKGAKATFFQVGECAKKYPEISKKILKSGHVIGNHSMNHAFHKYFTQPGYQQETASSQAVLKDILGKEPALVRPPWLVRQPMIFKTFKRNGLRPISGIFCHPLEVFHLSGEKIAKRAISKAKPGSIIIFHDGYNAKGADRTQTVKAVKLVVEELSRQGYKFVTVSELLKLPAYQ